MLGSWIGQRRHRLFHDEQAQIGHVLADLGWQRIFRGHHRGEKDRPELSVVQQRVAEIRLAAVPAVFDGLEARRGLEQQVGSSSRGLAISLATARYACAALCIGKNLLLVNDQFVGVLQCLIYLPC